MVGGRTWYFVFAKTLLVMFLPLHMLSVTLDSMKTGEGSKNHEYSCVIPALQVGEPSARSLVFLTVVESEEKPTNHQSKVSHDLCSTTVVNCGAKLSLA